MLINYFNLFLIPWKNLDIQDSYQKQVNMTPYNFRMKIH